ncbi:hypothetical protein [Bradyrhizobium embrapense]|uniref:hypothetical protein n=1 Tax=Bradyrhizobium embrapense TaxID=630921 RepID=UPI00067C7E43|nr:hypothetical protein [Bradyrhizobium embrapense]
MKQFDERTTANLDVVLDDVCRDLPKAGGDHETRKFIARKLLRAAQQGKKTLGALKRVARRALRGVLEGRPA